MCDGDAMVFTLLLLVILNTASGGVFVNIHVPSSARLSSLTTKS